MASQEPMRAGGHINRRDGRGWVLADSAPEPEPTAEVDEAPSETPSIVPKPTAETDAGSGTGTEAEQSSNDEPSAVEPTPKPSDAAVRAWAREAGLEVPARGRVPADLVDAYVREHDADTDEPTETLEEDSDGAD